MRLFGLSDIHVDYDVNASWIAGLSLQEYTCDVLILAGDVSRTADLLERHIEVLARRFRKVAFVPGNHDLWVEPEVRKGNSLDKYKQIMVAAERAGATTTPLRVGSLTIIPLAGWYDYTFGEPSADLREMWHDYRACQWPTGWTEHDISAAFAAGNQTHTAPESEDVITFSHFVPRIDVMPSAIPPRFRMLYPVLGSSRLETQLRRLGSKMHVYGHSHVNRWIELDGVAYVNNAFGYPGETHISAKRLLCLRELPDHQEGKPT